MSWKCLVLTALAGSALACSVPSYDSTPQLGPDAGGALPGDAAAAAPTQTTQPGRASLPSAASFDVMTGRAVSGTLELSNATLTNVPTTCTASLCAAGALTP